MTTMPTITEIFDETIMLKGWDEPGADPLEQIQAFLSRAMQGLIRSGEIVLVLPFHRANLLRQILEANPGIARVIIDEPVDTRWHPMYEVPIPAQEPVELRKPSIEDFRDLANTRGLIPKHEKRKDLARNAPKPHYAKHNTSYGSKRRGKGRT
jgi:hypothetical protein